MATDPSLAAALEREHREIDEGIEAFTSALAVGERAHEPLKRAAHGLRRHIFLEEEFLFPALRSGGLMAAIAVMLREHAQLWVTLDQLEADLNTGADDDTVAARCRELVVLLQHHNPKEERVIYPQADEALPEDAAAKLAEVLESGELPEGWVCERVRSAPGQ